MRMTEKNERLADVHLRVFCELCSEVALSKVIIRHLCAHIAGLVLWKKQKHVNN